MNLKQAEEVLKICATAREKKADPVWVNEIRVLRQSIVDANSYKTVLSALGTALLAKATEPEVSAFALRSKVKNGYSTRSLSQKVLVPFQWDLRYDLLSIGPEPMAAHPFLGRDFINEDLASQAKGRGKPIFAKLLFLLAALERPHTRKELKSYLSAFLVACASKPKPRMSQSFSVTSVAEWKPLADCIRYFCEECAEDGKRAQAVAQAFVGVLGGMRHVRGKSVNDPSRSVPGDILIWSRGMNAAIAGEVRAKLQINNDVINLLRDLQDMEEPKIKKALFLAVHKDQGELAYELIATEARKKGIHVRVYIGWDDFLEDMIFWARDTISTVDMTADVLRRIQEIGVSERGQEVWKQACRRFLK